MSDESELAYWRTLAEERLRQIEELRARMLGLVGSIADAHVPALAMALDVSRPAWLRELDLMSASTVPEPADVTVVLEELWRTVAAETDR